MERKIIKIVRRWLNELVGGYHLPYLAKVVAVAEPRTEAAYCDSFNPHYSVDVQILDARMGIDESFPIFTALPVPVPCAGEHRGFFGLPQKGAIVEIAFARGLPSLPFIRTVLPHEIHVPGIDGDQMRWNASVDTYQQADKEGNWLRTTTKDIVDVSDNLTEQIEKIRTSVAGEKQIIEGGKVWLGDSSTNVLQVLSDLIGLVSQLSQTISTHNHPSVGAPPAQAAAFTTHSTNADAINQKITPIIAD